MTIHIQYTDSKGDACSGLFTHLNLSPALEPHIVSTNGIEIALSDMHRVVVLDGTDALTEQIAALDEQMTPALLALAAQTLQLPEDALVDYGRHQIDEHTKAFKVALKMHEIMALSLRAPEQMESTTRTPAVYQVALGDRTRIGWRFEKMSNARVGSRHKYDHGTVGNQDNLDAQVVAIPPMTSDQTAVYLRNLPQANRPAAMVFLLNSGDLVGGATWIQESTGRFQIHGQLYEPSQIACATPIPDEHSPVWKPKAAAGQPTDLASNPAHGQFVFAWDTDRCQATHAGPYVDFAKFDATGKSNMRFQGSTGAFLGGNPWASKKSWATLETLAKHTMLREFHGLRQHLSQQITVALQAPAADPQPPLNRPKR